MAFGLSSFGTTPFANGVVPYALTVSFGAYALTGFTSARAIGFPVPYASYSLTGFTSARAIGFSISYASYSLTGFALGRAFGFPISYASYSLTGLPAVFDRNKLPLVAGVGYYTLTGLPAVDFAAFLTTPNVRQLPETLSVRRRAPATLTK